MSADHPRKIISGTKTQTRRIINPQPPTEVTFAGQYRASNQPYDGEFDWCLGDPKDVDSWTMADTEHFRCRYGGIGDQLWVREAWRTEELRSGMDGIVYKADAVFRAIENTKEAANEWIRVNDNGKYKDKWRHAMFMPRWASRITLEITEVRVERVQDIHYADVIAEGLTEWLTDEQQTDSAHKHAAKEDYGKLWDSINAKREGGIYAWAKNPWVWTITFRRINEHIRSRPRNTRSCRT